MSGAKPLLPLYAAMAWTGKTLPFIVTNSIKQSHSLEAGSSPAGQELNGKKQWIRKRVHKNALSPYLPLC